MNETDALTQQAAAVLAAARALRAAQRDGGDVDAAQARLDAEVSIGTVVYAEATKPVLSFEAEDPAPDDDDEAYDEAYEAALHAFEKAAENAWLRAAEMGNGWDDQEGIW
jgi:hypothetical protein